MYLLLRWRLMLSVLAISVDKATATCNQCGTLSGVACLNQTAFSICDGGVIVGPIETCPANTVCSDTSAICSSPSVQAADCPPTCGTCSTDLRFACVNATTFAFCFGTQTPSSVVSACPANQFCDTTVSAPPFCSTNANNVCTGNATAPPTTVPPATTTIPPVTSTAPPATTANPPATTTVTPVTTTNPPGTTTVTPVTTTTPQPASYCQQIGGLNGARYTAPYATSCRGYILCYVYNSILNGALYYCPGTTVFNNRTAVCVSPSSYTCPPNF